MAPATTYRPGPKRAPKRGRRGFTLLETVLVAALVLAAAGATVAGLSGWQRTASLNAGVSRFETLLRLLRAEAANRGRRMRLAFCPAGAAAGEGAAFEVLVEADPLSAPEVFTPCGEALMNGGSPAGLVRVLSCRVTGQGPQGVGDRGLAPVTFSPDGFSGDSARLHLVSADPRDTRVAVIDLDGLTGAAAGRLMSRQEYEESIDDAGSDGWARAPW